MNKIGVYVAGSIPNYKRHLKENQDFHSILCEFRFPVFSAVIMKMIMHHQHVVSVCECFCVFRVPFLFVTYGVE